MIKKFLCHSSIFILLMMVASSTSAKSPDMGDDYFPYDGCPDGEEQFPMYDCGNGLMIWRNVSTIFDV